MLIGDPVIERKKMSVYVMEIPLATEVSTIPTWYRGEPTSYMLAGSVVLTANSVELRFLHEGTANSIHAIQLFREDARLFDPGMPESKLPASLDLSFMSKALDSYRKKDFKQAMAEIDGITAKGSDYYKGYVLTWIAGRLDFGDQDLKILQRATSYLESASLRDPNHTAARMRLWQNQDFIKAVTYINQAGYSHLFEETGTGWGERRKTAQSLLRNVIPGDPLFYLAVLNLGRVTYWVGQESDDPGSLALARDYFQTIFKQYPGHPVVRMYLGEKLAWGQQYAEQVPGAPKWAMRMREALGRLNDLIDFWISRQSETGEFGGGWGDDVEMMRWWQPAAYATGSDKITRSMQKLADGIWMKSGIIRDGYFRGLAEVQYSSEPTADTQPNMLALRFGDPVYYERCLATGYLMKNLWTSINPKNQRLFKSVDIGAHKVGQDTRRAFNVPYHSRATLPAQWAACYSHNPDLVKMFEELAESWLEACARTDKGKPAGIPPAGIAFATSEIGGYETTWYNPKLDAIYFTFPGGIDLLFEQLLTVYELTGKRKYLKPIEDCMGLIASAQGGNQAKGSVGGELWVARVLQSSASLGRVWDKWRMVTGDDRFDEYLKVYGSAYMRWYLTRDNKFLEEGCEKIIDSIGSNFALLTSEVRYTDRINVIGVSHLMSMATGEAGLAGACPSWQITWEPNNRNFAALVSRVDDKRQPGKRTFLRSLVFNFGNEPIETKVRLWSFAPGDYEVLRGPVGKGQDTMDYEEDSKGFKYLSRGTPLVIEIPPGLHEIHIKQTSPLNDINMHRPDIAVSPGSIFVYPTSPDAGERFVVAAKVHNIGSIDAEGVEVVLETSDGNAWQELKRLTLDRVVSPKELKPAAVYVWADALVDGSTKQIRVTATIPGLGEGEEQTTENNTATVKIKQSEDPKPNAAFRELFLGGKLSDEMLPLWLELAEVFTGENRTPISAQRAEEIRRGLNNAKLKGGVSEKRLIDSLRSYVDKVGQKE